jgi:hypothetical protein
MTTTTNRVYLARQGTFPGWWVVGGCFAILFFGSSLGFYGMGVYLNAFSKEFGWNISSLSVATTFFFLIGGLWNVVVARLITKFDVRYLMYGGAVVGAGSLYMMGHVSQKWHLFVVYAVFAIAWSSSGLTAATTVVTRWFHVKRASAIAAASSGLSVGGILLTPFIKKLIDDQQMSGASIWLALIWLFGMSVPAYLLIRPDPLALNWMPDGEPKPENHVEDLPGVPMAIAVRTKFFWIVTIGYILVMGSQVGAIEQPRERLRLQPPCCRVQALCSVWLAERSFRSFHLQSSWCLSLPCKVRPSSSLARWRTPFCYLFPSDFLVRWWATY